MGTKPDFGTWEELLMTTGARLCIPLGALPTQAAENGVAVQLQGDGNGFLIAGGPPHSSAHTEFIFPFVKF